MPSLAEEFRRSWLTCVIGLGILCFGIWLLTWNEGRAVNQSHSLDEAYNAVIALNPFEPVRPELDGHLVYITGPIDVDEPVTEPDYGISILAVKLKRRVQMYQWVEERTERDPPGQNTDTSGDFYYITEWRDKLVDSSNFYIRYGHQNPTEMPLKSQVQMSPSVRIGQMYLGDEIKKKFINYNEVTGDERPDRKDIKLHAGIYYHCDDVWNPEVGDIRVQFYYAGVAGEVVTIIAKQKDKTLVPYITSKGHEVAFLRHGSLSINQMFSAEHSDVKYETWKYRFVGTTILYAASIPLSKLLGILFLHVPYLRNVVVGDVNPPVNFALALSLALIVVATAWIAYRPWLGAGLLAASISPFLYCTMGVYNVVNQNGVNNR